MKQIVAPINPNSSKPEIGNLQDCLVLLLGKGIISVDPQDLQTFTVGLRREQFVQRYSDNTQKLISIFQEQHHLAKGGLVDDQTAGELNKALQALGAFDAPNPSVERQRVVSGRVEAISTPSTGRYAPFMRMTRPGSTLSGWVRAARTPRGPTPFTMSSCPRAISLTC